ncbi:related to tyrosyl-tRNA synthetase, mitochondrial precursor [Ustilago trichophora]|uniref:Tyrosine--tRNA ligase n=1 Tax=Ustilago trichophora TaxID=86804 RepID=A0A5C3E9B9_9BASI|nr:related to tyrosyl-tRNA synthetase, mitochondrial precursor [Ustilago trichophora]
MTFFPALFLQDTSLPASSLPTMAGRAATVRALASRPRLTLPTLLAGCSSSRAIATSSAATPHTAHRSRRTSLTTFNTLRASYTTEAAKRDLIDELDKRGLIQTLTSRAIRSHLSTAPRVVYSGVDPSAPSLHVGNLLPLFTLAHFARYDHKPIVLVGGATGSIGDPSGRSTERNALDKKVLEANVEGIKRQLKAFFANVHEYYSEKGETIGNSKESSTAQGVQLGMGIQLMNNYDWTKDVTLLDFLGSVGRHARLTQMLARDSVASRLSPQTPPSSDSSPSSAGGMSYTEFSYQLLQAYDFSHLHTTSSCTVQIGGSDQLGNITAGIDLIRRTTGLSHDDPAFGLTLPLLTTSSGEKFGKSAGNAVWLDGDKTSDLDFYQFFLRSTDADVGRYLRCLTLLDVEYVDEVLGLHEGEKKKRLAQRVLADHITSLIRGKAAAQKCKALTDILFSHTTNLGSDATAAAKDALSKLDLRSITEKDNILTNLDEDVTKVVVSAGLVKSRGEAKRLLASGGLYVNNRQIGKDDGGENGVLEEDLVEAEGGEGKVCLLRAGKGAVRVVHIAN